MSTVHAKRSPSGSSLIELTCALFVMCVGIFGVIHLYMNGLDKMRAIGEYETALCALSNEIETLRALPPGSLSPGESLPFRSETPGMDRLHLADARVDAAPWPSAPNELMQVTARIQWRGEHGRLMEKRLTTLIAQPKEDDIYASHS